jgi:hypothetical protein
MEEEPEHNVRYPVEVVNEDGTINHNYWLKVIGKSIRLFGKMDNITWELERIPINMAQVRRPDRKDHRKWEKIVLQWLYNRCRDLQNLEDLFTRGSVELVKKQIEYVDTGSHVTFEELEDMEDEEVVKDDRLRTMKKHVCPKDRIKVMKKASGDKSKDKEQEIHRGKHIIIHGKLQSGKSSFMLCAALRYMFSSQRMSTIIVLRDAKGDYNQLKIRLEEMQDELNEHLREKKLEIGMREKIARGGVYPLEVPAYYMGVEKTILRKLPDATSKPSNKVTDIPWEKDANLNEFVNYFSSLDAHLDDFMGKYHPRHCLMTIGNVIEPQRKLFGYIAKYDIAVILYNGEGVDLYHKSIPSTKITVEYSRDKHTTSVPTPWHKGGHTFSGKVGIATVLQWLKDNGGVKRFPRIITISGKLAGRGISFTSKDYGKYLRGFNSPYGRPDFMGWRLTSMYYLVPKTTNQPNLLQGAGRLACIVRDNIPTYLYTTEQIFSDIRKAYWTQEELLARARIIQHDCQNILLRDAIQQIKIQADKVSKRHLTLNEDRRLPKENLVKDDRKQPGAFDKKETYDKLQPDTNKDEIDQFNHSFETIIDEIYEEKERVEQIKNGKIVKELPDVEFKRLTEKMFPKWATEDSKIARFMQNLDPKKVYMKTEIEEYTRTYGIVNIGQLLDINVGTNGYGTIIKKVGNNYWLYPELIIVFEKFF